MATAPKKPAAKAASKTAVATVKRAQVALPEDYEAKMAAEVASFQNRMAAPTGNGIGVTQDRKFRSPDDTKHDTISGVIVDFVARNRWYVNEFDKDETVPPNCFAIDFATHDALTRSDNSPDPQGDGDCRTCPKGQWGSCKGGTLEGGTKKGKACKNEYVLALLAPSGEGPLMTLTLSATALKPFDKYVRDLSRDFKAAPYAFLTEFFMDDKVDYSSVRCGSPEDIRGTELFAIAFSRRDEARALLEKEPDVSEFEEKVGSKMRSALKAPKKPGVKPAARR